MSGDLFIEMLGRFRRRSPRTMRSALGLIADVTGRRLGADACALLLAGERSVYLAGRLRNPTRAEIAAAVGAPRAVDWRWRCFDGEPDGAGGPLATRVAPFHAGGEIAGSFALIRDGESFGPEATAATAAIVEGVSALLGPIVGYGGEGGGSTRLELLDAINDPPMMRGVLDRIASESGAEFCAFYAGGADRRLSARISCPELAPHLQEIRRKLLTAHGMFANDTGAALLGEEVSFRREEGNVAYLLGTTRIESYFLVPVIFDAVVRGVLYVGSVRRDAFVRENIAALRSLAEEDGRRTPIRFSVGGEVESLRRIVRAIPAGIALVGTDGGIVASNDAFAAALRLPGDPDGPIDEVFRRAGFRVDSGDGSREQIVRGGPREDRYLHIDRAPLGDLAPDVSLIVAARDVTAERAAARRLEEATAMTAHELRTPLTALRNALGIMRDAGDAAPVGERFLQTAVQTADRLALIVDGLVDASGLRGGGRMHPQRVDAGRFVRDAARLFEPTFRRRDIALDIAVEDGERALRVDRDAATQIVQNLLSNCLRHVPAGRRVEIDARPADFTATGWQEDARRLLGDLHRIVPAARPAFIDLVVRDTGDGIPAAVAAQINRPSRETGPLDGSSPGLGLSIARRLAGRLDGALVIERPPSGGTAAHLVLPADDRTAAAVAAARRAEEALDDMTERGLRPVVYALEKDDRRCWIDVAAGWRGRVLVEPASEEIDDEGLSVWLFDERYAVAVSASNRLVSNPLSFLNGSRGFLRLLDGGPEDSLRVDWAIVSRRETNLPSALEAARNQTAATVTVAANKGEPG